MATTQETSDSDAAEIRVAEEDTFNSAPTSKNGQVLRHNGFTVNLDTETESADEIRSDRQQSDVTRTGFMTSGDISYLQSFATYDLFMEHALLSSFEYAHTISGTMGTDSTNDQVTSDTSASGPDLSAIVEGQEFKINGFSSSVDGVYTASTVDTSGTVHKITVAESIGSDVTGDGDEDINYNFQTGTLSVDSTNDQFTVDTSTAGNPTFDGYEQGQWIKTTGFANDGNNDYFYITNVDTSATTHKITVRKSLSTDETGVSGVKLGGQRLQNGTNLKSLYFEKEFTDLSSTAITYYPGQRVVGWDHDVSDQSNISGSFSIQGIDEDANNSSTQLSGSPDSANSNEVYSTADNVPRLLEGGNDYPVQSFDFSMDNSPRDLAVIGQAQKLNIKMGQISVTGSISIYLNDPSIYEKYTNFTDTSFSVIEEDDDGNAYIKTIHKANFDDGSEDPDSADSDIITDLSFEASKDEDAETGKTIQVDRFPGDVI